MVRFEEVGLLLLEIKRASTQLEGFFLVGGALKSCNGKDLGVKGQNVCLARRVAGVRFGLFECRLSGCSRCR